jgi:hypothetical protein
LSWRAALRAAFIITLRRAECCIEASYPNDFDWSCAGLTRAPIKKTKAEKSFQSMDCRVKPGNDAVAGGGEENS